MAIKMKFFSRRSFSPAVKAINVSSDRQTPEQLEMDYARLLSEHRRLLQITARIATKIGVQAPVKVDPRGPTSSSKGAQVIPSDVVTDTSSSKSTTSSLDDDIHCPPPHVILAQAHRLHKLNELVVALSQVAGVAEAYKTVAQYTREIVGAARVSIAVLVGPTGEEISFCHDGNHEEASLEIYGLDGREGILRMGLRLPIENTVIGHVVKTRKPARVMDTGRSEWLDCKNLNQMGIQACIDVPLISSGRVMGTLNTGVTDSAVYFPEVEQMLLQIASVLASAMEKERLLEQALAVRQKQEKEWVCSLCRYRKEEEK